MSNKDELSDQLNLTTKLAAQMERMSAVADQLEQSYSSQVDTVQKLATAFGQINTSGFIDGMNTMTKSMMDFQGKVNTVGKTSESAFKKMSKTVEDAGKAFKDKFPKSVGLAVGAISGFAQSIRDVLSAGKGIAGFIATFVGGIGSITMSILSIPLKIFEGLVDMASKGPQMTEFAQAVEDVRKQFGAFSGPGSKAVFDTFENFKGFQATGLSVYRVFGNWAEQLQAVLKLATALGPTFDLMINEFKESGGAIMGFQKGLGLSEEAMKGVSMRAITMGTKAVPMFIDMTKQTQALGKAFGLTAKVLARDVGEALKDVKHFGSMTVKELAESATYTHKLGLEFKDILGIVDAFDSFDTAAQNAAKLGQAFGIQVDAFKMMKEQDPAKRIDMVRKAMAKSGIDASKMDRQNIALLASTTGLSEEQTRQAFSLKNQGASMKDIQKQGDLAAKKTMTQEQAMAKLSDSIERMVKAGTLANSYWQNFVNGISAGLQYSKDFRDIMVGIRKGLWDVFHIGMQLGRALPTIFPGLKDILGGLADFFKPQKFANLFSGISKEVTKLLSGEDSISAFMEHLQSTFADFYDDQKPAGRRIIEGFKTAFKFLTGVVADGIGWMSDKLKAGIEYFTDLLTGKEKITGAAAKGPAGEALGFMSDIFGTIADALKSAWSKLKGPLSTLISKLWSMAKEEFWIQVKAHSDELETIGKYILGYIFAKTLAGAAMGMLADVVLKAATGVVTATAGGLLKAGENILTKMFSNAGSKMAADAVTKTVSDGLGSAASSAGAKTFTDTIAKQAAGGITSSMPDAAKSFSQSVKGAGIGTAIAGVAIAAISVWIASEGMKLMDKSNKTSLSIASEARAADQKAFMTVTDRATREQKEAALQNLQSQISATEKKTKDDLTYGMGFNTEDNLNALKGMKDTQKKIQDSMSKAAMTQTMDTSGANNPKPGEAPKPEDSNAQFFGALNLDEAKQKFDTLKTFSGQLQNFDLAGTIANIRKKFEGVDFTILSNPTSQATLMTAELTMNMLSNFASSLVTSLDSITKLPASLKKVTTVVKDNAFKPALDAVSNMVTAANTLNDALGNKSLNAINIKAKLENFANAVGLGGTASYTVNPSKEVAITVNMTVTMNVGEVERVMLERKGSIIRDRLNFATNTPDQKGNSEVSSTHGTTPNPESSPIKPIVGG